MKRFTVRSTTRTLITDKNDHSAFIAIFLLISTKYYYIAELAQMPVLIAHYVEYGDFLNLYNGGQGNSIFHHRTNVCIAGPLKSKGSIARAADRYRQTSQNCRKKRRLRVNSSYAMQAYDTTSNVIGPF